MARVIREIVAWIVLGLIMLWLHNLLDLLT